MPAFSTPSPVATNAIKCSQPMCHRAQSMGPDVHPGLLRAAVPGIRILSVISGRLWELVMGQIFLEIVYRLVKGEGICNSQERLTEGKSFLTSLIVFYGVMPGSLNEGGAVDVEYFSKAFDTIFNSIFIANLMRYSLDG